MTPKKPPLLIGAHISIAGGIEKCIERGESIGCTTIQIFTKSNRQWNAKELKQEEIDAFKTAYKESCIESVIVHSTYLINIGSPNIETAQKSTKALAIELKRCDQLGIKYLVLHPGSHLKTDETECLIRIAHNLDKAFEMAGGSTHVLLETMAGQGSGTCYAFEHIAHIRKHAKNTRRIGVCFDTCHVFVAGYDFSTPAQYKNMWDEFDRTIGLNALKCIHVNDSKKELGSRVDRHAEIGKGEISLEAFRLLFNDPRFFNTPKILETPKDTLEDDYKNMQVIIGLLSDETKKKLEIQEPK